MSKRLRDSNCLTCRMRKFKFDEEHKNEQILDSSGSSYKEMKWETNTKKQSNERNTHIEPISKPMQNDVLLRVWTMKMKESIEWTK
jgi:hypothetical protein